MPTARRPESKGQPPSLTGVTFSLLAVVLLALGGWFWSTPRTEPGVLADGGRLVKGTLHLETFVLNLADAEHRSYLRVGIDLGLDRELGRGENTAPVGVRDTILGVLAKSRVDELLTAKGKAKLKEDVLRALQGRMPGLGIEEVYFTEFLIQR
jgi:flagellar basal body-associated protein FliL